MPDVELGPSIGRETLDAHLAGLVLPPAHLEALCSVNGLTAYGGYFRLFGAGPWAVIDLADWNNPECWKFAWPGGLDRFICFGGTAWGDQYAYDLAELSADAPSASVYFLEAIGMEPEVIAPDFQSFLEREFLRNAREPYDTLVKQVRARLGDLMPREHITHVPSILLTETEDPGSVMKLDAVAAMIANGDLWVQLASTPTERAVRSLDVYTDDRGRPRVRVVWH